MKIKLSQRQWEAIGKKDGLDNGASSRKQLIDVIQQIKKIENDFRNISANLPKDKWILIGEDCDSVVKYLDNAHGRISTIIHKTR